MPGAENRPHDAEHDHLEACIDRPVPEGAELEQIRDAECGRDEREPGHETGEQAVLPGSRRTNEHREAGGDNEVEHQRRAVDLHHIRLLRALFADPGVGHPGAAKERPVPQGADREASDGGNDDGEPVDVCKSL